MDAVLRAGAPDWLDRPLLLEIDKSPLLMTAIGFVILAIMIGPRLGQNMTLA